MAEIAPFHVMALLGRAKALEAEGRSIIHMEVGEPDFSTPEPIIAAAQQALLDGKTHYTPSLGLPELRCAISDFYRQRYGELVEPERIIITPGASGALMLALGVTINPADEVLMADPGYPCNRHFVRLLEGVARSVPVDAATQYQLTPMLVDRYWGQQSRAVMVASPSNPTGTLLPQAELQSIQTLVERRDGWLLVDEIYHNLIYGPQPPSAVNLGANTLVINSFSKYFSMTGWRLGWLVVPKALVCEVEKLAQNLYIAAPTLAQYAALAAFTPQCQQILEQRRQQFQQRRDYLMAALKGLGFKVPVTPDGAFYIYADCSAWGSDSFALAQQLLEQAGVAITPGIDFGSHGPESYLRFAYTTSMENLRQGVARLADFRSTRGDEA